MTTFQPDGPRADAQVTVVDPIEVEVHDFYNGKRTWDGLSEEARVDIEDDARALKDFDAGIKVPGEFEYFWEADADSAAYAAADELGHIEKYATADEASL